MWDTCGYNVNTYMMDEFCSHYVHKFKYNRKKYTTMCD